MKMHITALEVINSKKDVKWLKISALSSDTGEVIETMLEASKVANREELEKAVLSKAREMIGEFFCKDIKEWCGSVEIDN